MKKEKSMHYQTNCVSSDGYDISDMVDDAIPVTLNTIRKYCSDLREWEQGMGYSTGNQRDGLKLKDDWAVSYYRSKFRGQRCYYIEHSHIEYVWF